MKASRWVVLEGQCKLSSETLDLDIGYSIMLLGKVVPVIPEDLVPGLGALLREDSR